MKACKYLTVVSWGDDECRLLKNQKNVPGSAKIAQPTLKSPIVPN